MAMIARDHELPVVRQCELLDLARSTAYYQPLPVPEADLALMRRIDELHLKWPFLGSRRIRDLLRSGPANLNSAISGNSGYKVGPKAV